MFCSIQRRTNVYIVVIMSTIQTCVECGGCSELPETMEKFGRELNVSTSQENESVVYSMIFPDTVGSVVDVQLLNGVASFELRQKESNVWDLQTKTCIKVNDTWVLELLFTLDSYTCHDPEFVVVAAQQAIPEYSVLVAEEEIDIGGDCDPGRTLNVYSLSSIITNINTCASFECSLFISDNYPDFWVENGTTIQTFLDKVQYNQPYALKARCFQTGGDPSKYKDTYVVVIFKQNATCTQGPRAGTSSDKPKTAVGCFEHTACVVGVASVVAYTAGIGTVIVMYFLSRKLCKQ